MNSAELMISVGVGERDSDALSIRCQGTPNQVLGFIRRARIELDKIEAKVIDDICKEADHA